VIVATRYDSRGILYRFVFRLYRSHDTCILAVFACLTLVLTLHDVVVCVFRLQFRDDVYHNILTSDLPNLLEHGNITALTQLWGSGQITNFEYLTHLNKHAGRSFNDLMQYPVFPFILRDYTSETLDLQDPTIYRSAYCNFIYLFYSASLAHSVSHSCVTYFFMMQEPKQTHCSPVKRERGSLCG